MRTLNVWRQLLAVVRHLVYPKTPAEHWEEQVRHHVPAPQVLEDAVNAAIKDAVPTMEAHGRTWFKGPPPHVGWWNSAHYPGGDYAPDTWHWWDGKHWTLWRDARRSPGIHAHRIEADRLWWNDYYPDNAVVPRMTPEQWKEKACASA